MVAKTVSFFYHKNDFSGEICMAAGIEAYNESNKWNRLILHVIITINNYNTFSLTLFLTTVIDTIHIENHDDRKCVTYILQMDEFINDLELID
jgi:hypothetical protein